MSHLHGYRDRVAGVPLRVRLALAVTGIVLLGLVAAGAATLTALHSYLIGRVDSDLQRVSAAQNRFEGDFGPPPGQSGFDPCHGHGLPSQFFVAHYAASGSGEGSCSSPLGRQSPPRLPNAPLGQLVNQPITVPSADGSSSWRILLKVSPTGDGDVTMWAESLTSTTSTVNRLLLLEVAVGLIVLVLMAGGGYFVVRRSLRPLTEVETTAAAIAEGDLSRRVPPGDERTEVGRLAAALNVMLAQIESAFSAQARSEQQARSSEQQMRRFVADASHELRTPLTSIRGFAELYRMGAAGAKDDPEVARLMSRIEAESTRMGGLVEDLLLLARLDERRPMQRRPVDLTVIAADVVHDAHAVQRTRKLTLSADGPVVVDGDEQRLRQVVHNLVNNALTHTPVGAPVEVIVSTSPLGAARLAVIDHGPGIPAEQAEHVFERFWRADASRARAAGGTGLGLAIVAEIVEAHGGTVRVVPTEGGGATFEISLPPAAAPASADTFAAPQPV